MSHILVCLPSFRISLVLRFRDALYCQGPELGYRVEASKAHLKGVGLRVAVVMSFDSRLTHEDDHVRERQ